MKQKKSAGVISRRKFLKQLGAGAAAFSGIYILPRALSAESGHEAGTSEGRHKGLEGPGVKHLTHEVLKKRYDAPVAVYRGERPAEAAYNVLKILKPALKADRVLIKPNMASTIRGVRSPVPEDLARILKSLTTNPEFVEGIIVYLREEGIKVENIVVAEGTGKPGHMPGYCEILGYTAFLAKMKVKFVSLNAPESYEVRIEDARRLKSIHIEKPAFDYMTDGVFINVPKLKMHNYAVTTLSMKNLMGTIHPKERDEMHPELYEGYKQYDFKPVPRAHYMNGIKNFSERLADLSAFTPDINVVDGVIGGEGDGLFYSQGQKAVPSRIAFAGTNTVNVDAAAAHFMGYPAKNPAIGDLPELQTLPWLEYAGMSGYGKINAADVTLIGAEKPPKYEKQFNFHGLAPVRGFSDK